MMQPSLRVKLRLTFSLQNGTSIYVSNLDIEENIQKTEPLPFLQSFN